jgi:hypothetical protein
MKVYVADNVVQQDLTSVKYHAVLCVCVYVFGTTIYVHSAVLYTWLQKCRRVLVRTLNATLSVSLYRTYGQVKELRQ